MTSSKAGVFGQSWIENMQSAQGPGWETALRKSMQFTPLSWNDSEQKDF